MTLDHGIEFYGVIGDEICLLPSTLVMALGLDLLYMQYKKV